MGIFINMHIQVTTLTGKSITLNVEPTCEISELNSQIEASMGVPSEEQILIANGERLTGNLNSESQIYMVVDIDGGKKKEKEEDCCQKEEAHVHKKVKLAVLKY